MRGSERTLSAVCNSVEGGGCAGAESGLLERQRELSASVAESPEERAQQWRKKKNAGKEGTEKGAQ
jgi:hypothetical protein